MKKLQKMGKKWGRGGQIAAAVIIVALAVIDYAAMSELFEAMDIWGYRNYLAAGLMALLLEGLPFAISMPLSKKYSGISDRPLEAAREKMLLIIIIITLVLVFALVAFLRIMWMMKISDGHPIQAFLDGSYGTGGSRFENKQVFLKDCLFTISPILTSLLAGVLSMVFFPYNVLSHMGRRKDTAMERFLEAESEYLNAFQQAMDEQSALWNCVADPDQEEMPEKYEEFRSRVIQKARKKAGDDIVTIYPGQLQRYNAEIESELIGYLTRMSMHSTIPSNITSIDLERLIERFDQMQRDDADKWNYDDAGKAMLDELISVLDRTEYNQSTTEMDSEADF